MWQEQSSRSLGRFTTTNNSVLYSSLIFTFSLMFPILPISGLLLMVFPPAAIAPILLLAAASFLAAFEKSNPPTGISPNPCPEAGACAVQQNYRSSALILQPAKKMWQLTAGICVSRENRIRSCPVPIYLEPKNSLLSVIIPRTVSACDLAEY